MEPINGLERLARLLRKTAVDKDFRARPSRPIASSSTEKINREPIAALEQRVQEKIKNLQQVEASPSAVQHAVIESILAWEFGEKLRNEPKFVALVDRVKQHVEAEPDVKNALEKIYKKFVR